MQLPCKWDTGVPKASDDKNNVVAMTRMRNSNIPDDDGRILLAALAVLIAAHCSSIMVVTSTFEVKVQVQRP
jgi:hypothetical protein